MRRKPSLQWLAVVLATSLFVTLGSTSSQDAMTGQDGAAPQGRGQQGGRGGQQARDAQIQQATGTAMILGQVVSGDNGNPVRRARVSLSGQELRGQKVTTTDDQGQFVFTLLPAGRYNVNASKAGYVMIAYGAKAPGRAGTAILLADSQKLEVKPISLPKGGVVTGLVMDEYGEPAPGTPVRAMRQVIRTGEKRLESAGTDTTDDRGLYRIYGLQPGRYIVYAQPRNQGGGGLQTSIAAEIEAAVQQMQALATAANAQGGRGGGRGGLLGQLGGGRGQQALEELQQQFDASGQAMSAYAPVFYPGSTSPANATNVEIAAGQERFGVDFQLQLTQTSQIDGAVVSPDGTVPVGTQITLTPKDTLPGLPGSRLTARAGQDGQFTFRNVIPGEYSVAARAQIRTPDPAADAAATAAAAAQAAGRGGGRGGRGGRGGPPTEVLWALTDISVDGTDLSGLTLQLQGGMTISGRVAFDSQTQQAPTDLTRLRITLAPVGTQDVTFGNTAATVDASGNFTLKGVPPGRYSLRGTLAGGGRGGGIAGASPAAGATAGSGNWRLAAAMTGGRDALDFPLEIGPGGNASDVVLTFSDRSTELSGTLQDATGAATSDYSIIVFPYDKQYWQPQSRRIQSVRPGTDGRFIVRNLPAGSYMLVAVTDVEPGEWYDPDFLTQLAAAAMRLTLFDGEKKTQDIRLAGGG